MPLHVIVHYQSSHGDHGADVNKKDITGRLGRSPQANASDALRTDRPRVATVPRGWEKRPILPRGWEKVDEARHLYKWLFQLWIFCELEMCKT